MDQHRDLAMREDLDRLAAEYNRRNAVTAMRRHDNQVAAFRLRGVDDRQVRMLMLNLDRRAYNASCLRRSGYRAQSFLSMLLHTYSVLSWRVLDHLRVGGERTKRLQDRQHGDFGPDLFGQGDAVLDGFAGERRPVRGNQNVGIHRLLLDRGSLAPARAKSPFASCLRIDINSRWRFAPVFG